MSAAKSTSTNIARIKARMNVSPKSGCAKQPQRGLAYASALPWLGLLTGALLAASGILQYSPSELQADEAARINNTSISQDEWQRAIDAANQGRRTALNAAEKDAILQKLIDEELLIQLALNLGLAHGIPEVRGRLVQAAMEALSQDGRTAPNTAELQRFVRENPKLFLQTEKRRVAVFRKPASPHNDEKTQPVDLPTEALTQRQLQRWIGKQLSDIAFHTGGIGPIEGAHTVGQGNYRIEVLEILPARQPQITEIQEDLIRSVYRRSQREESLQEGLRQLRQDAQIVSAQSRN